MPSNWKINTQRNSMYLNWIRRQPCLKCSTIPCHAHHTESGGMGIKGSDYSAIPLCAYHHATLHATTSKRGDWTTEELKVILEELRSKYLKIKENKCVN